MKLQNVCNTVIAGLFVWVAQGVINDAKAGVNDPSPAFFQGQANAGEVVVFTDGPNGFREANFFDQNGNLVSGPFETNSPNANPPAQINNQNIGGQQYADTSAFLNSPFLQNGLLDVPKTPATGIFTTLKDKRCELLRSRGVALAASLALASDEDLESKSADRAAAELGVIIKLIKSMKCKKDLNGNIVPTSGTPEMNEIETSFQIKPTANGFGEMELLASFDGANPWTVFINTGYGGLNDRRTNARRKADLFSIVSGASLAITERLSVGLSGYVQTGKVKSNSLNSNLTG